MRVSNRFAGALVGCAVTTLGVQRTFAQEALRTALETDEAARLRERPVVRPGEDIMRWGPVTFDVSVGYSIEGSDNINYTQSDRETDLIHRPSLNIGMSYQASRQSRLELGVGIGYEAYMKNSELDRFFISPGSEIAFDVRAGDAVITLFDRFDYSQEVANEGALSGVARYPRLENVVGVRSVWRLQRMVWQVGYSHLNVFVTEDTSDLGQIDFSYLERADEQFFGRAGYNFDFPVEAGVEASGSLSDYEVSVQRDRYTVSAGPYLNWTAAQAFTISLRGGVVYTSFQATNDFAADSEFTSFYAGAQVNHRLTEHITYGLSATHDVRSGINPGSDYIESTEFGFDINWAMMRHVALSAGVLAEASEEVGLAGSSRSLSEKYNRLGVHGGVTYKLTDRLDLSARYAFVRKDSDIDLRSYDENRVTVGAAYRF